MRCQHSATKSITRGRVALPLFALLVMLLLSGCATRGTIDACRDVRNENPSLLQGRNAITP